MRRCFFYGNKSQLSSRSENDATINGFDVTLIDDAHSITDSDFLNAEQIIRHHNETLHGHYMSNTFQLSEIQRKTCFVQLMTLIGKIKSSEKAGNL